MKSNLLLLSFLITAIAAAPIPGPSGRSGSGGRSGHGSSSSGRGRGSHNDDSRVVTAYIDPNRAPQIADNLRQHAATYGADTLQKHGYDQNSRSENNHMRYEAGKYNAKVNGPRPNPEAEMEEMPPASTRDRGEPVSTAWVPQREQQHQAGRYTAAMKKANPNDRIEYGIEGEDIHGSSSHYSGSHQSSNSGNGGHDTRYGGSHESGYYGGSGSHGSSGYSKRAVAA